jgi:hypothetical protein
MGTVGGAFLVQSERVFFLCGGQKTARPAIYKIGSTVSLLRRFCSFAGQFETDHHLDLHSGQDWKKSFPAIHRARRAGFRDDHFRQ